MTWIENVSHSDDLRYDIEAIQMDFIYKIRNNFYITINHQKKVIHKHVNDFIKAILKACLNKKATYSVCCFAIIF